jgi:hypothetical protein
MASCPWLRCTGHAAQRLVFDSGTNYNENTIYVNGNFSFQVNTYLFLNLS